MEINHKKDNSHCETIVTKSDRLYDDEIVDINEAPR